MKTAIQRLLAARQQHDLTATAQLLAAVLQEQHPDSPLNAHAKQQFGCCCACIASTAPPASSHIPLLLAADVCFNYAYRAPGTPANRCPRHHQLLVAAPVS